MGRRDSDKSCSRSRSRSPKPKSSRKEKKHRKEKKERKEKIGRHSERSRERVKERDAGSEDRGRGGRENRDVEVMPIQEDRVRDDRDSEQDRKRRKILSPDPINGEAKISRVNVSDEPTSAEVTDVKEPEVEIERRRQRVKDWQEARRKKEEEAAREAAQQTEHPVLEPAKGWTLEDDEEDDEEDKQDGRVGDTLAPEAKGSEGAGDALDAFMEGNASAPPSNMPPISMKFMHIKKEEEEETFVVKGKKSVPTEKKPEISAKMEEEVDPLDAFMSDFIVPEAQKQIDIAKQTAAEIDKQKAKEVKVEKEAIAAGTAKAAGASLMIRASGSKKDEKTDIIKQEDANPSKPESKKRTKTRYETSSDEEDYSSEEDEEIDDENWLKNVMSGKLSKGDKLAQVDHSKIDYPSFKKDFYIEVPELARMSAAEVAELRSSLDGVKARGKNVPKPIKKWTQCGLPSRVLDILKKSGFEGPLPIQAQALPVIMSGRDCIGIAKTGSGKTLAFVLPMLRHIKDQRPLGQGDGPISMVMAPTRELVQQIGKEVKNFAKAANINVVTVFGGSGVANQISDLKRGTEVVVCTPGRMIDILATSNGKITNLRRVTYLVLDEADRMFDMGFEPQITRIVQGIRPDRQTVLFSATFPRAVEALAKQVLTDPVEIQVGGRSVVNSDISQFVEIRPESERFLRLLEILGEWYEKGKILVFVSSQDRCDAVFRDMLKSGYPCLSLHGGKEQTDRESTISDFKTNVCNVLVATSVAARGLDVKDLVLVLNYDPPNHHEDYIHRVGRTGRAGCKGTAITFLGPEDDKYAPDLVKALKESKQEIPSDLQTMCDAFTKKRETGLAQAHGSGYGGSGFKFDAHEENKRLAERKALMAEYKQGDDEDDDDDEAVRDDKKMEEEDDGIRIAGTGPRPEAIAIPSTTAAGGAIVSADGTMAGNVSAHVLAAQQVAAQISAQAAAAKASGAVTMTAGSQAQSNALAIAQPGPALNNPLVAAAQAVASQLASQVGLPSQAAQATGAARAAAFAAQLTAQHQAAMGNSGPHYEAELEINDFPQHSRWKVTHKDALSQITEMTGAAITTRGQYFRPGTAVPAGERKLFLLIEGPTELSVKRAKAEVKRVLEETTEKVMRRDAPAGATGRYSVM